MRTRNEDERMKEERERDVITEERRDVRSRKQLILKWNKKKRMNEETTSHKSVELRERKKWRKTEKKEREGRREKEGMSESCFSLFF